ncbi:3-deoxy-7-phosphoheptulonate synthase [Planosporangium thailandense]|uniref:Phospho-2-dehydro-3-deoxyheptonate aldolase n=1 Tax=Planosporangium thailandense TaxID=765197 RepID=A0ABX0XY11_9ACTN|nr:3-deoxy-7-phosphoheptulonate synthase [Planosporangium thailandense]NJC70698.1 3-deoxy-7-phosphoheptulonate synthase [Planosporangium thailandense]
MTLRLSAAPSALPDLAAQWRVLPAHQQPDWDDEWLVDKIRQDLTALPGLVEWDEVRRLREQLAEVAAGRAQVVQLGDCAEDPAECRPSPLIRKAQLLDSLADVMRQASSLPVVRVGRIAGQFAKPRSRPTDRYGDVELPAFRGHLVNGPEPTMAARRPDPLRLISGYQAARTATDFLRRHLGPDLWTSHEALILDYEVPLVRSDLDGRLLLTSTHWPWIGDRTRQPDGAHLALLAEISNPVACKVGPSTTVADLLAICERLDPDREPGRLTLISRIGADHVAERLPALVAAVRDAGHPAIWLCDPMHGNTVSVGGYKTRYLTTIQREVRDFVSAVTAAGGVPGGLHLETTPDLVTECVEDPSVADVVGARYTSLCDPRLNPVQALRVARVWCSR